MAGPGQRVAPRGGAQGGPSPAAEPGELPEGEGGEPSGSARARRERVLREARALARLSHPHVVTIYQIADEGPYPWLVMELVRGPSLEQRLAEGPLAPHEAARVGREVLAALRTRTPPTSSTAM